MQDSPCGHLPRWRRFGKTRPVPVPVPGTGSPDPKNKMQPARVCQFFPVPVVLLPRREERDNFSCFLIGDKEDQRIPFFEAQGWIRLGKPHRPPAEPEFPDAETVFQVQFSDGLSFCRRPGFHPDRVDMRCLEKRLEILYFLVLVRVGAPGKEGGPEAFCPFDDPRDLLVRDLVAF